MTWKPRDPASVLCTVFHLAFIWNVTFQYTIIGLLFITFFLTSLCNLNPFLLQEIYLSCYIFDSQFTSGCKIAYVCGREKEREREVGVVMSFYCLKTFFPLRPFLRAVCLHNLSASITDMYLQLLLVFPRKYLIPYIHTLFSQSECLVSMRSSNANFIDFIRIWWCNSFM